ncbi:MAG: DUF1326 domain-containing protein [Acidobacteria bacterium]|nr:DUF1326 domain-containing protein [Acidobacteriota bacterium]
MSTNEFYADAPRMERKGVWRSVIRLTVALLLMCAIGAGVFAAFHLTLRRPGAGAGRSGAATTTTTAPAASEASSTSTNLWAIRGALTETCTCSVPCTCNFGEQPSPHAYCYPFYSYHIQKGNYGDVSLDDLHFGSADLKNGRTMFIDERASERQREALRLILARIIERVPAADAEAKAKEIAPRVLYAAVKQEYGDRNNHLEVAGLGQFSANYVLGMDKSQPIVVRNNTTWRIRDTTKAKTTLYRIKAGKDVIDLKDTNSNQGEFEYTDKTDFGAPARWNCGACANDKSADGRGEQMCGR